MTSRGIESMMRPPKTLTCDEALEIVSASFDGEATVEELDHLASHLLECPECQASAEKLQEDDEGLRLSSLSRQRPLHQPTPPRHPLRRRPLAWGLGLAAAALLAVIYWPRGLDLPQAPSPSPALPQASSVDHLEDRLDAVRAQIEALEAGRELPEAPDLAPRANPFRSRRANPFTDSGKETSPFARSSILGAERRNLRKRPSTPT